MRKKKRQGNEHKQAERGKEESAFWEFGGHNEHETHILSPYCYSHADKNMISFPKEAKG